MAKEIALLKKSKNNQRTQKIRQSDHSSTYKLPNLIHIHLPT